MIRMMRVLRMRNFAAVCLAAAFSVFLLASQPAHALQADASPAAPPPPAAGIAGSDAAAPFQPSDYVLGSGDKVRVTVYGEESLSGQFVVAGTGFVSIPLVGEVQAAGLTLRDFQGAVEQSLRNGYLRDPRVSAEVLNYRPFYIMGEVDKPGQYPYTSGLTVLNAVATAGGFTYRANQKRVFIKRMNDQTERPLPLTGEVLVAPGDTIRITERLF